MSDDPHIQRFKVERPIPHVPQRVVSLVPSVTESLFDLNAGSRLIAVTAYCTRPADKVARLPKIGGTKNPDIARIIEMQPDLVILNQEENRKADADALAAAHIPIWVTNPRTVREAIDLLWLLMDVFEEASMVHRVRQIEINYEMTLKYMTAGKLLRGFVPIWREPWMTFNRDTYIHDLLYTCGIENVFADRDRHYPLAADLGQIAPLLPDDPRLADRDTRYPRITLDEVVAAQPEIVLLPDEPYAFGEFDLAEISRLDIPAAKNKRIYLVDGSFLTWHGTRIAYALSELPALVAGTNDE